MSLSVAVGSKLVLRNIDSLLVVMDRYAISQIRYRRTVLRVWQVTLYRVPRTSITGGKPTPRLPRSPAAVPHQ